MSLNTFECNYLTPLHFKGLTRSQHIKRWWRRLRWW